MQYIHSITISLKISTFDIVQSYQSVTKAIETLEGSKLNVQHHHQLWYDKTRAFSICNWNQTCQQTQLFFQTHCNKVLVENLEKSGIALPPKIAPLHIRPLKRLTKPDRPRASSQIFTLTSIGDFFM